MTFRQAQRDPRGRPCSYCGAFIGAKNPQHKPSCPSHVSVTLVPSPGLDDLVTALRREQERVAGEVLRAVDERLAALPPGWRVAARLAHETGGTRIDLQDRSPDDRTVMSPEWTLFEKREQVSCGYVEIDATAITAAATRNLAAVPDCLWCGADYCKSRERCPRCNQPTNVIPSEGTMPWCSMAPLSLPEDGWRFDASFEAVDLTNAAFEWAGT